MRQSFRPLILLFSGFLGASGVVLAAAASHGGDGRLLGAASTMCLAHAPVLLGLWLAGQRFKTAPFAALTLAAGTMLFAGDLLARHFGHGALFPMAAPIGGMGMILGWLLIGAGAFFPQRPE